MLTEKVRSMLRGVFEIIAGGFMRLGLLKPEVLWPELRDAYQDKKVGTLAAIMLEYEWERTAKANSTIIVVAGICTLFGILQLLPNEDVFRVYIISGLLYLLAKSRYALIEYRMKKGYYGTTEYEARAMMYFVLDHSDKFDFSDGDGLKGINPNRAAETSPSDEARVGVAP